MEEQNYQQENQPQPPAEERGQEPPSPGQKPLSQGQAQGAPSEGKGQDQGKAIAVFSYLGVLVLIPLLTEKENEFVQYHAKQGLALFLCEVAVMLVSWIPLLGQMIAFLAAIVWIALSLMGIMNVLNGEKKLLPLVGGLAKKFNL